MAILNSRAHRTFPPAYPDATLTRIAGTDHYAMEERPAEVIEALLTRLRRP
ncbi:alpha/beta fold hydrolase [Nocardia sp. IFM 10818]